MNELGFLNYFKENHNKLLKGSIIIGTEIQLNSVQASLIMQMRNVGLCENKSLNREVIGRIDIVFKYHQILYICELKFPKSNKKNWFWDALKVVGYCVYYKWQNEEFLIGERRMKPAIMAPLKRIKLHHEIIANKLGITLFGIEEDGEKYKIKEIKDRK
jgi:hypothetical protein